MEINTKARIHLKSKVMIEIFDKKAITEIRSCLQLKEDNQQVFIDYDSDDMQIIIKPKTNAGDFGAHVKGNAYRMATTLHQDFWSIPFFHEHGVELMDKTFYSVPVKADTESNIVIIDLSNAFLSLV